jgi:hypothetical protein
MREVLPQPHEPMKQHFKRPLARRESSGKSQKPLGNDETIVDSKGKDFIAEFHDPSKKWY